MTRWLFRATFFCVLGTSLACSDATAPGTVNESNLSFSLSVSRVNWFYSSTPVGYKGQNTIALNDRDRGELLWFSPNSVQVGDINPAEDSQSIRNDPVPALEIIYIPSDSAEAQLSWGGLVDAVGKDGDISGKQYLEIWLNDYIPFEHVRERRGELYIDVGQVSEDAVWDPQTPPLARNEMLDYEDHNLNGGKAEVNEDLGLDWLRNLEEPARRPGTKTFSRFAPTIDPAGDDRVLDIDENAPEKTIAQRIYKFSGINGTQGNQRLDGEDLNGNYQLDQVNTYREYRIALADSAVVDNRRDFPPSNQDPNSGWRLYRIPLTQFDQEVGGTPYLSQIQSVRLWFRGFAPADTLDLQVASLQFVASPDQ